MMGHCSVLHFRAGMQSFYVERFKLLGNNISVGKKKVVGFFCLFLSGFCLFVFS